MRLKLILWLGCVAVIFSGCASDHQENIDSLHSSGSQNHEVVETKRANGPNKVTLVDISRKVHELVLIQYQFSTPPEIDVDTEETEEGYESFVVFGSGRDANGELTGVVPGGHALFFFDKNGNLLRTIGGA